MQGKSHPISRPGGSKIVLVGPSCPSRVLRGGEAAGYGRRAAMGGGGEGAGGGCPPSRAKHGRSSLVTVREATGSSLLGPG